MQNVILVGLINSDLEKIGMVLTDNLDFFYLNCEEFIKYTLQDQEKMVDICGLEYMAAQENKVIRSLNSYQNTVISMTYETFSNNINNILTNATIIYLRLTHKQLQHHIELVKKASGNGIKVGNLEISDLVFEERDKFLKKNCNYEVKYGIHNLNETVEKIRSKLMGDAR